MAKPQPPGSPSSSRMNLFIPPFSPKAAPSAQLDADFRPFQPSAAALRRLPSLEELQRKYKGHSITPRMTMTRATTDTIETTDISKAGGTVASGPPLAESINPARKLNCDSDLPGLDPLSCDPSCSLSQPIDPHSKPTTSSGNTARSLVDGVQTELHPPSQALVRASPSKRLMLPPSALSRAGISAQPDQGSDMPDKSSPKEAGNMVSEDKYGDAEMTGTGASHLKTESQLTPSARTTKLKPNRSNKRPPSKPSRLSASASKTSPTHISPLSMSPSNSSIRPPGDMIDLMQTKLLNEIDQLGIKPVSPRSAGMAIVPVPDAKVESSTKTDGEKSDTLDRGKQQDTTKSGAISSPRPKATNPNEIDTPQPAHLTTPYKGHGSPVDGIISSIVSDSSARPPAAQTEHMTRSPASQTAASPTPHLARLDTLSPTPASADTSGGGPRRPSMLQGQGQIYPPGQGKRVLSLSKLRDRMLARSKEKAEAMDQREGSKQQDEDEEEIHGKSADGDTNHDATDIDRTREKTVTGTDSTAGVDKENIIPLTSTSALTTKDKTPRRPTAASPILQDDGRKRSPPLGDGGKATESALKALAESIARSPRKSGAKPVYPYPLTYPWVLHRDDLAEGKKESSALREAQYAMKLYVLYTFETVIGFASAFSDENDMSRIQPSRLPLGSNIHLFKDGIMPMYEDARNAKGGRWTLLFKGNHPGPLFDQSWAYLIMALIGGHFPSTPYLSPTPASGAQSENEPGMSIKEPVESKYINDLVVEDCICGAVASKKKGVLRIQVWLKVSAVVDMVNEIGRRVLDVMDIDEGSGVAVEFQPHVTGLKSAPNPGYLSFSGLPSRPRTPSSTSLRNSQPVSPSPASRFVPASLVRGGQIGSGGDGNLFTGQMRSFQARSPLPRSGLAVPFGKGVSGLPSALSPNHLGPEQGHKSMSMGSSAQSESNSRKESEDPETPKTFASGYMLKQAGLPNAALMGAVQDSPSAGRGSSRAKSGAGTSGIKAEEADDTTKAEEVKQGQTSETLHGLD